MALPLVDNINLIRDKLFSFDEIITDNFVFSLNRFFSVTILVVFSILLSLSQYVGDPIDCIHDVSGIDSNTFDTFCWVEGTYTKRYSDGSSLDHMRCDRGIKDDCWHHKYYQWVALVLVCQAGFFFLPRFLWQTWEDGKIKSLISGLNRGTLIRGLQTKEALAEGEINDKIRDLVTNWKDMRGTNNAWASKFYVCEVLNLINVILQFKFTDFFLDYQFQRVGLTGLTLEIHNSVLPITAECFFNSTGTGGRMNTYSGLCVLPLNMVNQKFYTLFWLWLSFLLLANSVMVAFRLIIIVSVEMREFILRYVYRMKDINYTIVKKSSHGDWLLLTFLLDNMNVLVSSEFIKEVGKLKLYDEDAH